MAIYAWEHFENGQWNIIGYQSPPERFPFPMVTTNEAAAMALAPIAMSHCARTGLNVRVVRYDNIAVLGEFIATT